MPEHDRERVEEHDLDVKDDKDHRHEVEPHREAGGGLSDGGYPGLVRTDLRRVEMAVGAQDAGGHERADREQQGQDDEEQDREVLVHRVVRLASVRRHLTFGYRHGSPSGMGRPLIGCLTSSIAPVLRRAAKGPADERSEAMNPTNPAADHECDVLVIGAGPSGSSCAYWLAKAGHDVVLVERKAFPREKTCGDGLTPRSVRQLQDMGLAQELASCHRYEGLRSHGFGRSLELPWPAVPGLPRYGYVVTRKDLDAMVADHAAKAGATLWGHTEAAEPIMEGPALRGAHLVAKGEDGHSGRVTARYVVVADGANSRFGWSIGNQRNRSYPQGMALRGYWTSPRHDEPWIDSWLDLRDQAGNAMPGYGWIFPLGDGRVNVGVGLLTTSAKWKGANTTQMLEAFCSFVPKSWGISPETCLRQPPAAGSPWACPSAPVGAYAPGGRRRQRDDQPVQWRGHRLRVRDRAAGGGGPGPGAHE